MYQLVLYLGLFHVCVCQLQPLRDRQPNTASEFVWQQSSCGCCRWVDGTVPGQLVAGFDQEAAAVLMARLATFKMEMVRPHMPHVVLGGVHLHVALRVMQLGVCSTRLSHLLRSLVTRLHYKAEVAH